MFSVANVTVELAVSSLHLALVLNTPGIDGERSQTPKTFGFPPEVMLSALRGFPATIPAPHWLHLLPLKLGVSEWAPHPMAHIWFSKWSHVTQKALHMVGEARWPLLPLVLHCSLKTVKTLPCRNWKELVMSHPRAETLNTCIEITLLLLYY